MGSVRLYNGANLVSTVQWAPTGCSADGVTWGAETVPTYFGAVTRMEIDAPSVLTKPITFPDDIPKNGFYGGKYDLSFYEVEYIPPPTPPAIQVACTPQFPVRGENVSCIASLTPGQGTVMSVNKWTFVGLGVPSSITETTSANPWTGTAAFGGTVIVDATVDGVGKTGSAQFAVTARTGWSSKHAVHVVYKAPSTLPPHPTEDGNLGQTRSFPFGWAPPERISKVTSGPNKNWYYAIDLPLKDSSEIMINTAALSQGSDFYNLQRTKASGSWCLRSNVLPFIPLAEAHEGLNLELYSHAGTYGRTLEQVGGDLVEGAVGPTPGDLAAAARDAAQTAINAADDASERVDTDHPIPYCKFKYF